jgi:hypothetical protein
LIFIAALFLRGDCAIVAGVVQNSAERKGVRLEKGSGPKKGSGSIGRLDGPHGRAPGSNLTPFSSPFAPF